MSKKSRRERAKYRNVGKTPGKETAQTIYQKRVPIESKIIPSSKVANTQSTHVDQSRYVLSELKRISIIAGSLVFIIIILSFIIK